MGNIITIWVNFSRIGEFLATTLPSSAADEVSGAADDEHDSPMRENLHAVWVIRKEFIRNECGLTTSSNFEALYSNSDAMTS